MTDLKQITGQRPQNPANSATITVGDKTYIPMSAPRAKLWAPEMPGWHLHWMRGNAQRIGMALQAGYEFVTPEELEEHGGMYSHDLGGDAVGGGSTDLGTRVSVVSGDEFGRDGQAERLYLMRCKEEIWQASQEFVSERNEKVADAIRGGKVQDPAHPGEPGTTYVRGQNPQNMVAIRGVGRPASLFTKKS